MASKLPSIWHPERRLQEMYRKCGWQLPGLPSCCGPSAENPSVRSSAKNPSLRPLTSSRSGGWTPEVSTPCYGSWLRSCQCHQIHRWSKKLVESLVLKAIFGCLFWLGSKDWFRRAVSSSLCFWHQSHIKTFCWNFWFVDFWCLCSFQDFFF